MSAVRTELLELETILVLLLVLCRRIVSILAIAALQCDYFAHSSVDGGRHCSRRSSLRHIQSHDAVPSDQEFMLTVLPAIANPDASFVHVT